MDKAKLNEIVRLHGLWLRGDSTGVRADLSGANLSRADLSGANLSGAILSRADLSGADLFGADLSGANLSRADLSRANLSGAMLSRADLSRADLFGAILSRADLSGATLFGAILSRADLSGANLFGAMLSRADLSRANLSGANLSRANLSEANLSRADLSRANLSGAILSRADLFGAILSGAKHDTFQIIPEYGSFIGFKKLKYDVIAVLKIPAKAKRVNSTGRKCRAEFVRVLRLYDLSSKQYLPKDAIAYDKHTGKTAYKVGEIVRPDSFNPDIREECTNGIHFFVTKQEAMEY